MLIESTYKVNMMQIRRGAQAYARVGLETAVMSASPHQLIVLLFDGLDKAIYQARWAIEQGDIAMKGAMLSKAIAIIDEGLRAALDIEQGAIGEDLERLYAYMSHSLVKVNASNDLDLLSHVEQLAGDIGGAWRAIAPGV